MGLLDRVGRPRKYVVPTIRQNHQIVILRKPEANTLLATALISPYLYRRIGIMFDDRTRPAYAFAPPEIRRPILLDRALLDHVPKGCLLAVSNRQAFEAKPPPLKLRLAIDKILLEPGVDRIKASSMPCDLCQTLKDWL